MGRLIDADNLRAQIEAHEIDTRFTLTDYEYGYNNGLDKAEDEVDEAETVEAIPLTWINGYLTWLYDMNSVFGNRKALAIQAMLKKWEMEQAAECKDSCPIGGSE